HRLLPAGPSEAGRDGEPSRQARGRERSVPRDEGGRGRAHGADVRVAGADRGAEVGGVARSEARLRGGFAPDPRSLAVALLGEHDMTYRHALPLALVLAMPVIAAPVAAQPERVTHSVHTPFHDVVDTLHRAIQN